MLYLYMSDYNYIFSIRIYVYKDIVKNSDVMNKLFQPIVLISFKFEVGSA